MRKPDSPAAGAIEEGGWARLWRRPMLLAFLYAVVCGLLRLLLARGTRLAVAEIELLALRHERRVLRRRTGGAAPARGREPLPAS